MTSLSSDEDPAQALASSQSDVLLDTESLRFRTLMTVLRETFGARARFSVTRNGAILFEETYSAGDAPHEARWMAESTAHPEYRLLSIFGPHAQDGESAAALLNSVHDTLMLRLGDAGGVEGTIHRVCSLLAGSYALRGVTGTLPDGSTQTLRYQDILKRALSFGVNPEAFPPSEGRRRLYGILVSPALMMVERTATELASENTPQWHLEREVLRAASGILSAAFFGDEKMPEADSAVMARAYRWLHDYLLKISEELLVASGAYSELAADWIE